MKLLRSLHGRLVGTYVALALLLLTITGLVFSRAFTAYAHEVQQQRYRDMASQAHRVAQESNGAPEETIELLQRTFPELEFTLVRFDKAFPATSPGEADRPLPEPRLFGPGRENNEGQRMMLRAIFPNGMVIMARPKPGGNPVFAALYQETILVLTASLALALLVGWSFSRWLSHPVARLSQATAAVAGGDFLQQVPPTGTHELDQLAEQFNRMVARLDESFRSLAAERDLAQRFAADAAHELRTPLTALRAYYELAATSPVRTAQVIEPLGRQIDRLERIMAGLLQLARLNEGTGIQLTTGDLIEAIRPLVSGFRALAEDYDHQFHFAEEATPPLPVRLDPRLLELVLTNLMENACKFTRPGGEIRLSLRSDGHEAAIAVTDNGPGIPAEELPLIFDRFHRGLGTQEIPGSGLGLSIVQEAARRLGGRVSAESEVGQGSTFILRLPLYTPSHEA